MPAGERAGIGRDADDPFSFRDMASPEEGFRAVIELYGDSAAARVMELAGRARAEGNDADDRFRTAVYARVSSASIQEIETEAQSRARPCRRRI